MSISDLCVVQHSDFEKIFDNFFEIEWIDISKKISLSKAYSNFSIFKIHFKNPKDISWFLKELFSHIITFSWEDYWTLTDEENKQKKSMDVLSKYIKKLNEKSLEELERWAHLDIRNSKGTQYEVDLDLESMNKLRELGEIILFFFTESILKAPLLLSKVKLKTNSNMPVHGYDWIHISSNWEALILWESKLTNNFENWKKQSRESIVEHSSKFWISNEVSILARNFLSANPEKSTIIRSLISPYHNEKLKMEELPYELTCFLWYECNNFKEFLEKKNKSAYLKSLYYKVESLLNYYQLNKSELKEKKINFFLLPIYDIFSLLQEYGLKIS